MLGIGHFFAGFALALFSLFYFIYDGRGIFTFLLKFFPWASRDRVDQAALRGWGSLSSFVRATILVALVDSLGVLIVALILGVPVAPALAALVFLGAFVPIVGALVAGSVAVLVALVALGWVQALIMLGGDHPGPAGGGPRPAAVPAWTGREVASVGGDHSIAVGIIAAASSGR